MSGSAPFFHAMAPTLPGPIAPAYGDKDTSAYLLPSVEAKVSFSRKPKKRGSLSIRF